MPAVLVTRSAITQNLPFIFQLVAKTITSTHCN